MSSPRNADSSIPVYVVCSIRALVALGVVILCAGVVAGCGDAVPSNAIATVGHAIIPKAAFDHWLAVQNNAMPTIPLGTRPGPLDPPNFTRCVSVHETTDPKPPFNIKPMTRAEIKALCQKRYRAARDQTEAFLITAYWIQGEADAQGVKVTRADATRTLATIEAQRFRTPADLQRFLSISGETQEDLRFRVRIDTLSNRLRQKVTSQSAVIKHFEGRWRSRTTCAPGYVVADCKNAPHQLRTTTSGPFTPQSTVIGK